MDGPHHVVHSVLAAATFAEGRLRGNQDQHRHKERQVKTHLGLSAVKYLHINIFFKKSEKHEGT